MTPLVLTTGLLGSGKTSLLRRLLPLLKDAGVRPHVILNDYANANLDSATLRKWVEDVRPLTGRAASAATPASACLRRWPRWRWESGMWWTRRDKSPYARAWRG